MNSFAHVEHFESFVVSCFGEKFISTDALGFGIQFNQNTQKHYLKTDQRWINSTKNESINYTDLAFAGDRICVECV